MRVCVAQCALLIAFGSVGCTVGCTVEAGPDEALREPSRLTYPEQAGPILARRCGDFSCHGNDVQAFGQFAVGRRRQLAGDRFTARPLTEAEWDANYRATLGFIDADRPTDTTLLQKALAIGGKGAHKGGPVFQHPSDPQCQAVRAWMQAAP